MSVAAWDNYVVAIESALEQQRPGAWRRANVEEFERARLAVPTVKAAWRIDLPGRYHKHSSVSHGILLLDAAFPKSEPRIIVPEAIAEAATPWPHVERSGLLCLKTTAYDAPAADRVLATLRDAIEVLNYTEGDRDREFRREIIPYWIRRGSKRAPIGRSLVSPDGGDRDIVYARLGNGVLLFADDIHSLRIWLGNGGIETDDSYPSTRLIWMDPIPTPLQYPKVGRDLIDRVGAGNLEPHFRPGVALPVLVGVKPETGVAFIGVRLETPERKVVSRGFRDAYRIPKSLLGNFYRGRPVTRFDVERLDRSWVLGRDHNPEAAHLNTKCVAIIGCGAVGGYVARLLVQAGICSLILIDSDMMKSHNPARHVLGMNNLGRDKTTALAGALKREFPHIGSIGCVNKKFGSLAESELADLEDVDLIISCGIDFKGDVLVDDWRRGLSNPMPWLCAWVEEYAQAGHAIALLGGSSLLDGFDAAGRFLGRLTSGWPMAETHPVEAGCGNAFQPFGAVELQRSVAMTAGLALGILLGDIKSSSRRVWMGDPETVRRLGGRPGKEFNEAFCERTRPWPP